MPITSCRLPVVLLLVTITLAACGSGEKKDGSQVAAKVNGDEISISQINQVLSRANGVTEANAAKARFEILAKLIDQDLAVAKAIEDKLDRTPGVVMAQEAARREILARAYYEKVASGVASSSAIDAQKYYDEHPDLFANRRIYSLVDIAFKADDKALVLIKNMIASNKSMQDIAQTLKANGILFEAHNYTNAAEQLSLELLPAIAKLHDGQTGVMVTGSVVHVINVIKSQQSSVTFKTAAPQIQKYLDSSAKQKLVVAEIKRLKDAAKIEYLGQFNAAAPVATPEVAVKPDDAAQIKADDAASIAKGAAGLK